MREDTRPLPADSGHSGRHKMSLDDLFEDEDVKSFGEQMTSRSGDATPCHEAKDDLEALFGELDTTEPVTAASPLRPVESQEDDFDFGELDREAARKHQLEVQRQQLALTQERRHCEAMAKRQAWGRNGEEQTGKTVQGRHLETNTLWELLLSEEKMFRQVMGLPTTAMSSQTEEQQEPAQAEPEQVLAERLFSFEEASPSVSSPADEFDMGLSDDLFTFDESPEEVVVDVASPFVSSLNGISVDLWFAEGDEELQAALAVLGASFPRTQLPRDGIAFLFVGCDGGASVEACVQHEGEQETHFCAEREVLEEINQQDRRWKVIAFGSDALQVGQQVLLCRLNSKLAGIALESGGSSWPFREFGEWLDWSRGRHVFFMNPDASSFVLRESPWWSSLASNGRFHVVLCATRQMRTMASDRDSGRVASIINFSRHSRQFYPQAWRHVLDLDGDGSGQGGLYRRESVEDLRQELLAEEDEGSLGLLRGCRAPAAYELKERIAEGVPALCELSLPMTMRMRQVAFHAVSGLLDGRRGPELTEGDFAAFRESVLRRLCQSLPPSEPELDGDWRHFRCLLLGVVSYRCAVRLCGCLQESVRHLVTVLAGEACTAHVLLTLYQHGLSDLEYGVAVSEVLEDWHREVTTCVSQDYVGYAALGQSVERYLSELGQSELSQDVADALRRLYGCLHERASVSALVRRPDLNGRLHYVLEELRACPCRSEVPERLVEESGRLAEALAEVSQRCGMDMSAALAGHPLAERFPFSIPCLTVIASLSPGEAMGLLGLLTGK